MKKVLTEQHLRFMVKEEIATSYGHLSLREQRELEEQLMAGLRSMFGGAKKAAGKVADKATGAISGVVGSAKTAIKNKVEAATKYVGDVTKDITDAYNSGKADVLEAEAEKLEATATKLRADADALRKQNTPNTTTVPQTTEAIAESVFLKLRNLNKKPS